MQYNKSNFVFLPLDWYTHIHRARATVLPLISYHLALTFLKEVRYLSPTVPSIRKHAVRRSSLNILHTQPLDNYSLELVGCEMSPDDERIRTNTA